MLRCRLAQLPILNGSPLDLFNLYVEVCKSGGHECTINWKGQVGRAASRPPPPSPITPPLPPCRPRCVDRANDDPRALLANGRCSRR